MSILISNAYAATSDAHEAVAFYASPEFWVSMAFVIVVVAFAKPITKILKKATKERADKISKKIEEARKLKDEAAELLAEYERKFKDADVESAAIIERAKQNAERFKKQAEEKMNLALAKKEEQAFDRIQSAQNSASTEIKNYAIESSGKAAIFLLSQPLKPAVTSQMLTSSIKELPSDLHKIAV